MKNKICAVLAMLLLSGCTKQAVTNLPTPSPTIPSPTPTPEETEPAEREEPIETAEAIEEDLSVYDAILEKDYQLLRNGVKEGEVVEDGQAGLQDYLYMFDGPELLRRMGYTYLDLNHDGVTELVIGFNRLFEEDVSSGTVLTAAYTIKDDQPVLLLDGMSRSSYLLSDDGSLMYYGSNGAARSIMGHYYLREGAEQLSCDAFYFSEPDETDPETIRFYFNTTGDYEVSKSEEIPEEEFNAWSETSAAHLWEVELIPFRTYGQGAVSAEADSKQAGWIVFTAREDITDFEVLEIELKETEDGYTFETTAVDDAYGDLKNGDSASRYFEMEGSIPGYAIRYIDATGTEHRYTVSLSGYDGSVELEAY